MDLRQLEHFVAVAETLNFRAAAERLHMTQPPLSVSIRKLEKEIGAALFVRSRHRVQLTRAGEAALSDAKASLFHAHQVAEVASSTASGLTGSLRIGFVGSAQNSLLPRLLPRFQAAYPGVVLRLTEANNTWLLDALERDHVDCGIVRIPLTQRRDITILPVERDQFVAAMPTNHRFARNADVTLNELADEPFIDYTATDVPGLHALTTILFAQAGVVPRVTQETTQVQTVLFLVESGLGVALVPSRAARRAPRGVAFRALRDVPSGGIGLGIAYNPDFETATAARLRQLAESLSAE